MSFRGIATAAGVALAAATLSGCAAMDWGSHLAAFKYTQDDRNDAVVLVAGGSREYCGPNPTSIRILAQGDHSPMTAKGITGFNSALDTSMYKDHQGVLAAMRLPPGNYYAILWPFNAVNFVPTTVPHANFTVKAGEVVYLGEMYLENGCDLKNRVSYRDEFDRDMAILKTANSALAHAPIQKRILDPNTPPADAS